MPTHVIEGSHSVPGSGALAGEQIYADNTPPTDLIAVDTNAIYHGLRALVRQEQISGDLTAPDGATDLSEGFIRLSKAFRRAARRFQSGNIQTVTVNATPLVFSTPPDVMVYSLIDQTPTPLAADSFVHPDPNTNSQNKNRLIYIINDTSAVRKVGHSVSGRYARLGPGDGCLFYGNDDGSGTTFWRPIDVQLDPMALAYQQLSVAWYQASDHSNFTSALMQYMFHGPGRRLMTLNLPLTQITIGGSSESTLVLGLDAGFSNLPINMIPIADVSSGPANSPYWPVFVTINGTMEVAVIHWANVFGAAPNNISLRRQSGDFPASGVIQIFPLSLTYIVAR